MKKATARPFRVGYGLSSWQAFVLGRIFRRTDPWRLSAPTLGGSWGLPILLPKIQVLYSRMEVGVHLHFWAK